VEIASFQPQTCATDAKVLPGKTTTAGIRTPGGTDIFPFLSKHIALSMTIQDLLRTIYAHRQDLPADLAEDVKAHLSSETRKELRDDLICQAYLLLTGKDSVKPATLARLANRIHHTHRPADPVKALLWEAAQFDRLPTCSKSYERKIKKFLDMQAVEMSE
jgi:hypothetical protein